MNLPSKRRIISDNTFGFRFDNYKVKELISLKNFGILSLKGIDDHFISVILFKENCPFETSLIITKKFSQRLKDLIT